MNNAQRELIHFLESENSISDEPLVLLCAEVTYEDSDLPYEHPQKEVKFALKQGYTPAQYEDFLNQLDFKYDDGYGTQEVFGTLWFTNGTWAIRYEYDGSEWWKLVEKPPIPDSLK